MELTSLEKEIIIAFRNKPKWYLDRAISLLTIVTRRICRAELDANMEWFKKRWFEIHEDEE